MIETTRKRLSFLAGTDKAAHHRYAGGSGQSRDPHVRAAIAADSKVREKEQALADRMQTGGDPGRHLVDAAVARREAAEAHQKVAETHSGAVTREHYARTGSKHQAAGEKHAAEAAKHPAGRSALRGSPGNSSSEIRERIARGEPGPVGADHPDVERWITIDGRVVPVTSEGISPK